MGLSVNSPLDEIERHTQAAVDFLTPYLEMSKAENAPLEDLNLFVEHLQGKKILDVGCGLAYYVDEFTQRSLEYTGIDLSGKMIEVSRKAHPSCTFEQMSFRKLAFADESFDGLWCCCVFGHEPKRNMPAVLAELRRVLRPSGILSVILPYTDYSDESVSSLTVNEKLETIWTMWEFVEFSDALTEAGFKIIDAFPRLKNGSFSFIAQK